MTGRPKGDEAITGLIQRGEPVAEIRRQADRRGAAGGSAGAERETLIPVSDGVADPMTKGAGGLAPPGLL